MNLRNIVLRETSRPQTLQTIWLHLYDIREKAKLQGQKADRWLSGTGESTAQGLEGTFRG